MSLINLGIVIPVLGLVGVSLSLIASTTPTLFFQQLVFFLIGVFLFFIFASIDFRIWLKSIWLLYVISLFLLLASFFAPETRGTTRWINIGWLNLQPAELIKPFIIILMAAMIAKEKTGSLLSMIKPFILLLPIVILIFKQPDLGNVIIYLFTYVALEVFSGLSIAYILAGIALLGAILPALWLILREYQRVRVLTFFDPYADPMGAGYNALQAVIAIGSGGLLGLGLGRGTQSHLLFLPEYHTDFVFASLGEELGFLGAGLVLLFYFIILVKILLVVSATRDGFGKLVCIGIFAQIFIQVFINIGMNLGLVPITGITLPLLSYGGSSIVATLISLGLVTSVARINKYKSPIVIR